MLDARPLSHAAELGSQVHSEVHWRGIFRVLSFSESMREMPRSTACFMLVHYPRLFCLDFTRQSSTSTSLPNALGRRARKAPSRYDDDHGESPTKRRKDDKAPKPSSSRPAATKVRLLKTGLPLLLASRNSFKKSFLSSQSFFFPLLSFYF